MWNYAFNEKTELVDYLKRGNRDRTLLMLARIFEERTGQTPRSGRSVEEMVGELIETAGFEPTELRERCRRELGRERLRNI